MITHHHTTFGGSEDIVRGTVIYNMNPCCHLDLEHSSPTFSLDDLPYHDVPKSKNRLQKGQQFNIYILQKETQFVYISPHRDLDLEGSSSVSSNNTPVQMQIWLRKSLAVHKLSSVGKFIESVNLCCDLDLEHKS